MLFVSCCYPWPLNSGGHLRRFHIASHLAQRHEVTFLAIQYGLSMDEGRIEECPLFKQCSRVMVLDAKELVSKERLRRFHSFAPIGQRLRDLVTWPLSTEAGRWTGDEFVGRLRQIREEVRPDVTWVDRSFVAEGMKAAGFENLTVDLDDLMTGFRWRELRHAKWYKSKPLHYLELAKLALYERNLPKRFDRVVVCKEEDRRFFSRRDNVFVVPNGTSAAPQADQNDEHEGTLLFVGTLEYDPNIDAVHYFARDIWPVIRSTHPEARVSVVGRNPGEGLYKLAAESQMQIEGNVPSVEPYYQQASVVVSPLRLGAGTKLKVLEALAYGKALVATKHSVEGLGLRPGIDFELANDARGFAAACSRLLKDPQRRRELGASGRQRVMAQFDWSAVGQKAELALGMRL